MTELALSQSNNFMIAPKSLSEAMEFARMISSSSLCPKTFERKPGDVLIAMQMGAEVGLSPMQSIQNIAVINGRPCLWGDAALAVVQASPQYISHREWVDGNENDGTLTAHCAINRKGQEEYIKSFSQKDAEKAGLWSKAGVWKLYPSRMLQMRARAFAIRDKFADALRGINIKEEVEDHQNEKSNNLVEIKAKNNVSQHKPINPPVVIDASFEKVDELEIQFTEFKEGIENCENEESLRDTLKNIKGSNFKSRPDLFKQLIDLKDQKKAELMAKTAKIADEYFVEEQVDAETGEIKNA